MSDEITTNVNDQEIDPSKYQVLITGIFWSNRTTSQYRNKKDQDVELPTQFTLDLPENILNRANKKQNDFNDVIEEFCYNFLTRKFGREVNRCQIWLPLEEKV